MSSYAGDPPNGSEQARLEPAVGAAVNASLSRSSGAPLAASATADEMDGDLSDSLSFSNSGSSNSLGATNGHGLNGAAGAAVSASGSKTHMPISNKDLPVAVDAMGGDLGFPAQVEGAVQAYKEFGVRSILVGPENDIRGKLAGLGASSLPIQVKHASEVITMDDSPARAVRRKPDSSLCVAYRLVCDGQASAVLSSGNSGATMAAGGMIAGFLPGIERPAIATLIPVAGNSHPNVMLDVGANVECDAQNLVQFALMGAIYYSSLFEGDRPRVALLSNGSEASKGTDTIRGASLVLSKMELVNYIGYVEGRDVVTDAADVIVCDGFVGNVLLKAMEGCVRLFDKQIRFEGKANKFYGLGLLLTKGLFRKIFDEKFDYANYGGAPLLGLSKLSIVLHGSSDARATKNAIRMAQSFTNSGMTEKITSALTQLDERFPTLDSDLLGGGFSQRSTAQPANELRSQEAESRSSDIRGGVKDEKTPSTN